MSSAMSTEGDGRGGGGEGDCVLVVMRGGVEEDVCGVLSVTV